MGQRRPGQYKPKPLRPGEVAEEWREYYAFNRQELRPGRQDHLTLQIWVTCPDCGQGRWKSASRARGEMLTPLCRPCTRRRQRGAGHPPWKGGRGHTASGYIWLHINGLCPRDRLLAKSMATRIGHIPEHRLVMARHLDRPLQAGEIVHHINGIRDDNCLDNLRLLMKTTHHTGRGDNFYQQLQEALSEIERLQALLTKRGIGYE